MATAPRFKEGHKKERRFGTTLRQISRGEALEALEKARKRECKYSAQVIKRR